MTKRSHPELDGQHPETLYTFHFKRPGQTLRERLTWVAVGLSLGLSVTAGYIILNPNQIPKPWSPLQARATPGADPVYLGAERAMAAAELTQTAEFQEEWVEVALLWQQAIAHMQAVPQGSAQAELAQQKVVEYERNLQYAQSNVNSRPAREIADRAYWTVGSDRDLVMAIQGPPTQSMQYPSTCQQTLTYGTSIVEFNNGYVTQYNNQEGNLKVLAAGAIALSAQAAPNTWSLGSSEVDVVRVQGTPPTRREQYSSNRFTTLYYGNSSVVLDNGQVVGFVNTDKNLRAAIQVPPATGQTTPNTWTIGSSRSDVLRAEQQTPTAVSRNDASCEEVFHFDGGEVTFGQGFVSGYRDRTGTLKVR
jgi:hypothetical protein